MLETCFGNDLAFLASGFPNFICACVNTTYYFVSNTVDGTRDAITFLQNTGIIPTNTNKMFYVCPCPAEDRLVVISGNIDTLRSLCQDLN